MKKKLSLIAVLVLFALTLTGCLSKAVKTSDDFIELAEERDMKVTNAIDQFSYLGYIEEATIALSDGWQVEFYVLSDEANAENMFDTNVAKFESRKTGSSSSISTDMLNNESFGLTTGGAYMYVSRVENTLVYLDVEEEYKEAAVEFIDALGY